MREEPLSGNLGNIFSYLGKIYPIIAAALAEHISNALDEFRKAGKANAEPACRVDITLRADQIVIEYPYGMLEKESRAAIKRIADSLKVELSRNGIPQIGQKGIGILSVFQLGKKTVFTSFKNGEHSAFVLRDGSAKAEFPGVNKRDRLANPGIRISITQLNLNPTKDRGPLCRTKLENFFAQKYDADLRDGLLKIVIHEPRGTYEILPIRIDLPKVGEGYEQLFVAGDKKRKIGLELYYDRSGKGTVCIRHSRVTITNDFARLSAYGLEDSIFASGSLKGYIDADFLTPDPGRGSFEDNDDWKGLLAELDRIRPAIEAEVQLLAESETKQKSNNIHRKAIERVLEILDQDEFKDLDLLPGLGVRPPPRPPEPKLPPRGFDFFPESVRIDPGKTGTITLKAIVPKFVPNGTTVHFDIDNPDIEVVPKRAVLRAANGEVDEKTGLCVVSVKVRLSCKTKTETPATLTATAPTKIFTFSARASVRFAEPGPPREHKGGGFMYEEVPFDDAEVSLHSRFTAQKVVQANTRHPDFKKVHQGGSEEEQMAYAATIFFKETLVFNDRSGKANEFLEKMLSFGFRLQEAL